MCGRYLLDGVGKRLPEGLREEDTEDNTEQWQRTHNDPRQELIEHGWGQKQTTSGQVNEGGVHAFKIRLPQNLVSIKGSGHPNYKKNKKQHTKNLSMWNRNYLYR